MKNNFLALLFFLSSSVFSNESFAKIMSVGSITINSCQDAKAIADWYTKLGIEMKEAQGVYYGAIETAAGPFYLGIHHKKENTEKKCSGGVAVTYSIENFESSLLSLKNKGLLPESIESGEYGKFAYFHDPEGNEVTLWEGQ